MVKNSIFKTYVDVYKNRPNGLAGLDSNSIIPLDTVFPQILNPQNANSIVFENNNWTSKTLAALDTNAVSLTAVNSMNGVAGLDANSKLLVSVLPPLATSDLSDVLVSSPIDNEALAYDGASGKWTNRAQSATGSVPVTRTVNLKPLSTDIVLDSMDTGSVPLTRTVNGFSLATNVSLSAVDVGAIPIAQRNAADGVAGLDSSTKVLISHLPQLGFSSGLFSDLLISAPTAGQVMTYNGTRWVNSAASGAGGVNVGCELFSQILYADPSSATRFLVGVTKDNKRVYAVTANLPSWYRINFSTAAFAEPSSSIITKIACDNNGKIFVLFNTGNLWTVDDSPSVDSTFTSNVYNFWICERMGTGLTRTSNAIFINSNNTDLQCRGINSPGWFGLGNTTTQNTFTTISTTTFAPNNIRNLWHFSTVVSSLGVGFTVIQTTDFRIWFAGSNTNGVFGRGNTTASTSFVDLTSNWGNLFLPIENILVSYDVSGSATVNCLIHWKNGSADVLYQSGNINNTSVTTATSVPLTFLQANETISQLTYTGSVTVTQRIFLVTNLGNLYMRGYNTIGTAITNFTLIDTDITQILADKVTSVNANGAWYANTGSLANKWYPSLAIKNGELSLAGTAGTVNVSPNIKPCISGSLPTTTFTRCKFNTIVPNTLISSAVIWHYTSDQDLIPTPFANNTAVTNANPSIGGTAQGALNMIVLDTEGYIYTFLITNANSGMASNSAASTNNWPHYKMVGYPGVTDFNSRYFIMGNPLL